MSQELAAVEAVLNSDTEAASAILEGMAPTALQELMRACLITAGMARSAILGPMTDSDASEWAVRFAHRVVDDLEKERGPHES